MSKKNKQQQKHTGTTSVRQFRQIPNTMSCLFVHETKETTADFDWSGPQLNAIWPEVLAFFRWTQETYRSESQVRLFVNTQTHEWKAWAFPQKANLGMSAKELDERDPGYERTKEQRAMFTDEWFYWGTVHHHCTASAFQSGTDQENERGQDGIHITVGNLGSPTYDIHTRLYIDKFKLVMDLCDFWDIGNELNTLPRHISRLLKDDAFNEMAKIQMGQPPALDQTFPEIWKENIIDCTPKRVEVSSVSVGPRTYDPSSGPTHGMRPLTMRGKPNFESDIRKAAGAMMYAMEHPQSTIKTVEELVSTLKNMTVFLDDEMIDLMDIMSKNDVLPQNLIDWLEKRIKWKEAPKEITAETRGPATAQQVLGYNNQHEGHQPNSNDYTGGREWEHMGG